MQAIHLIWGSLSKKVITTGAGFYSYFFVVSEKKRTFARRNSHVRVFVESKKFTILSKSSMNLMFDISSAMPTKAEECK